MPRLKVHYYIVLKECCIECYDDLLEAGHHIIIITVIIIVRKKTPCNGMHSSRMPRLFTAAPATRAPGPSLSMITSLLLTLAEVFAAGAAAVAKGQLMGRI